MTKIMTGTTALRTTTAAIAALVFVQSGIAQAQDASGGVQSSIADTQDSDENAIIVTARRIEEKLSEVPVTVAAFDSEALAQRQINSEETLQIATPGLTTKQSISSNYLNYAIRGQSVGAFSYSPPAVVTYFNEVPVGGTSATTFFDLSSIQVLKGPQGTLFGRNATGGAVIYQSQLPNSEFEGYLRAGYGNFDNTEIEGAINIPISKHIALRVAGQQTAPLHHVLAHGQASALLLLITQQGQVGVKQIMGLIALSCLRQAHHVTQHIGEAIAGVGPIGTA